MVGAGARRAQRRAVPAAARPRGPASPSCPTGVRPARSPTTTRWPGCGEWEAAGGPVLEESVVAPVAARRSDTPPSEGLDASHFHRSIDTTWRRTSYSGLIRVAETTGVSSEPEVVELDDEVGDIPLAAAVDFGPDVPSPMADLPTGAKFGTLVHAVLETADPFATDLAAELESQVREHSVWWPVDVARDELAAAMVPMHDTPLGPLADGLDAAPDRTARSAAGVGLRVPLGRWRSACGRARTSGWPTSGPAARAPARRRPARLLRRPVDGRRARQSVAARVPERFGRRGAADSGRDGHRYVVVDYKTNWLGDARRTVDSRRLRAGRGWSRRCCTPTIRCRRCCTALCCIGSCVGGSRGTSPARHLGGVLYLFVRGMCGADTPVVDGHPAGVFSWQPPASLVTALSDLLDAGRAAA